MAKKINKINLSQNVWTSVVCIALQILTSLCDLSFLFLLVCFYAYFSFCRPLILSCIDRLKFFCTLASALMWSLFICGGRQVVLWRLFLIISLICITFGMFVVHYVWLWRRQILFCMSRACKLFFSDYILLLVLRLMLLSVILTCNTLYFMNIKYRWKATWQVWLA